MDNPRDDATLPVLGTPAELEVMDEATDYWADADDNGTEAGGLIDMPSPASLNL
ncbi:unnamed protein product [Rhizoctonia solani]|uniref:Uncharacterized protein n=1 Tax=Rhizoctonia solani TaxID=456999 RepID=A0A8H3ANQ1_9AGAM|nr:unnamed protein product [Rhizoctonia solani]